jgi:hypothetical protein
MTVHYRVHETAVQSFNLPGQPVYEDVVWKTAQTTRTLAILYAPKRTGKLAANIRASRPKPTGIYTLASSVSAAVGYAAFVHDGTTGPIYASGARYLKVPYRNGAQSKGKLFFFAESVRGQKANPFLEDALKQAMRTNDVLQYRVG